MTSNAAAFESVMTETYYALEKMILKVIYGYHKKFKVDIDELKSIAHEYFMEAVYSYNPERGNLTTHVWNRIRFGLMTEASKHHRQNGFLNARSLDHERVFTDGKEMTLKDKVESRRDFNLTVFLANLSDEAREVAQAALDIGKEGEPVTKERLLDVLKEAGWAACEILRAFREIKDALL